MPNENHHALWNSFCNHPHVCVDTHLALTRQAAALVLAIVRFTKEAQALAQTVVSTNHVAAICNALPDDSIDATRVDTNEIVKNTCTDTHDSERSFSLKANSVTANAIESSSSLSGTITVRKEMHAIAHAYIAATQHTDVQTATEWANTHLEKVLSMQRQRRGEVERERQKQIEDEHILQMHLDTAKERNERPPMIVLEKQAHALPPFTIGMIGCGMFGSAILDAMLESKLLPASAVSISTRRTNLPHLQKFREAGVSIYNDNARLVSECFVVIITCLPSQLPTVVASLRLRRRPASTFFISLCSGLSVKILKRQLNTDAVVRTLLLPRQQASKDVIANRIEQLCSDVCAALSASFSGMKALSYLQSECASIFSSLRSSLELDFGDCFAK